LPALCAHRPDAVSHRRARGTDGVLREAHVFLYGKPYI